MKNFLDSLASMPLLLMSGTAGAGTIYVDCNYAIPAPPLTHLASKVQFHAKWHSHKHKHAGGHHGARMALLHQMCPVWLDEGTTNVSLVDYDHDFGGWSDFGGGYDSGFGGDAEGGGFGGLSGGSGGSSIPPDLFLITLDTPPIVTPPPLFSPPCCGTPVVAVPETSTWLMVGLGLLALVFAKKVQKCSPRVGYGGSFHCYLRVATWLSPRILHGQEGGQEVG